MARSEPVALAEVRDALGKLKAALQRVRSTSPSTDTASTNTTNHAQQAVESSEPVDPSAQNRQVSTAESNGSNASNNTVQAGPNSSASAMSTYTFSAQPLPESESLLPDPFPPLLPEDLTLEACPDNLTLATVAHAKESFVAPIKDTDRMFDLGPEPVVSTTHASTSDAVSGDAVATSSPTDVLNDQDVIQDDEVLLSITFFSPKRPYLKEYEYLVLSSQPISALRDAFKCRNALIAGQEDPSLLSSAYVFIEDTFYVDTRHPDALDYSAPIREWSAQARDVTFSVAPMTERLFRDVHLAVNQVYLLQHLGQCQHRFVVSDVRGLSPDDPRDRNQYPFLTRRLRQKVRKCSICSLFAAKKIVLNDERTLQNPCYFCDKCWTGFGGDDAFQGVGTNVEVYSCHQAL